VTSAPASQRHIPVRALTLLLTLLTGFSGLVYEVTWQKGLAILLGSHSEATAAVLAIFLGGLSLGYHVFGVVSNRITRVAGPDAAARRLLQVYGLVELGIGLFALAWPSLFEVSRTLSVAFPFQAEAASFAFDILLTAALIGPPAVLMGGTIPLLTQALARDLEDATRFHAFVYGFNTLGAFLGALAGGFFLIPWLGIPTVIRSVALVNLAVGAAFVALSRTARGAVQPAAARVAPATPVGFASFAAAALLLGFAMMALQTVLIRVAGLALGASHFAFAMMVATFVLGIACGSLAVSAFRRIPAWATAACPLVLGMSLALLYPLLQYAPYAAHVVRSLFMSIDQAFYPYFLSIALGTLVVWFVPLALSGASLPLIFHALRREVGELGGLAGRIYAWNTVGSLLGALLGGYVLLYWLDLHHIYRIAIVATLVAGGILAIRTFALPRIATAALVTLASVGIALLPRWDPNELASGYFRQRKAMEVTWEGPRAMMQSRLETLGSKRAPIGMPFYDDDPISTVAVIDYLIGDRRTLALTTNGKNDGSLVGDYPTMGLVALLPCLMAERCENAFVIGVGTGVTAGELAQLDDMRRVVAAEISPGVIAALPLFDSGNQHASKNPKLELVRRDAYRALLHDPERWDVIASEPSNPWVAGVEMLYSREFLTAARDRLQPGGVYAQWMHAYEIDDPTLELVLRTYASVFDRVAVWYTMSWDLVLLGFAKDNPGPDLDRIAERSGHPDFKAALERSGITTLEELLAHELVPVGYATRASLTGEVHTLLHPLLSQRAAKAFFRGGNAQLPYLPDPRDGGARTALLQQLRERHPLDDDTRARVAQHVCSTRGEECAVLLARWYHDEPDSERLHGLLAELRERGPSTHLAQNNIEALASLFGSTPNRLGPEGVKALTDRYFQYFYRAEPFSIEALHSLWQSCLEPECAKLRVAAERRLNGERDRG